MSRLPPPLGRCRKAEGTIQTPPPSPGLGDPSLSKEGSFWGTWCGFEVQPTPSALRAATPPCLGRGAFGMELFLHLDSCLLSLVSCFLFPSPIEELVPNLLRVLVPNLLRVLVPNLLRDDSWLLSPVSCFLPPLKSLSRTCFGRVEGDVLTLSLNGMILTEKTQKLRFYGFFVSPLWKYICNSAQQKTQHLRCWVFLVAWGRLELPTSGLWIRRSNHLSYHAFFACANIETKNAPTNTKFYFFNPSLFQKKYNSIFANKNL